MGAKSQLKLITAKQQSGSGKENLLSSSDPEARALINLAIELKQLAPWQWMQETDLIGIQHPETGEIGFMSIMGTLGEHEALALYLGAEGFYDFIDMVADQRASADRVIAIRHLQAAFSDRMFLEKRDRDLLKELGFKFRGPSSWPMFRSYRPGYLPWFITPVEARFLIHALSQILEVARKVRYELRPFHPTGRVEKNGYLMRVSRKEESRLVWEDQVWLIPRPKQEPIRALIDPELLRELGRIPQNKLELEVDLFLMPGSIGKPGVRPLALYLLMLADGYSGFILGTDVKTAEESFVSMHASIPGSVAEMFLKNQIVPSTLTVRSELLRGLLTPLTQELNIELRRSEELPAVNEAAEALSAWMQREKV